MKYGVGFAVLNEGRSLIRAVARGRYSLLAAFSVTRIESNNNMTEPKPVGSESRDARFQDLAAPEVSSRETLAAANERARRAESRLAAIEGSRAWTWVGKYRRVRERLRKQSTYRTSSESTQAEHPSTRRDGWEAQVLDRLDAFAAWAEWARKSRSDQVVIMFSEAPEYHYPAATRPNRLTRVLLEAGCPVFFTYYRTDTEPLPPNEADPGLIQSPLDIMERILPKVLEGDFGDKQKVLVAAFPHLAMVRYLRYAQQLGWKVICDAGADWEQHAMVGAAPWYDPAYERYVIQSADAVIAVSDRLAQKIAVAFGREAVVVPNAHDSSFPMRQAEPDLEAPVLGYFGSLTDRWFDWKLLQRAAQLYPNIRFELIGHHFPPGLVLPENVEYLGCLSDLETVKVTAGWTGAFVPYKVGALVDAADLISAYEFVHLGLRTVATYSPQFVHFPGFLVSESPEVFLESLIELVQGETSRDGNEAQWLVSRTWEDRVASLQSVVSTAEVPPSMAAFLLGLRK